MKTSEFKRPNRNQAKLMSEFQLHIRPMTQARDNERIMQHCHPDVGLSLRILDEEGWRCQMWQIQ